MASKAWVGLREHILTFLKEGSLISISKSFQHAIRTAFQQS